MMPSTAWIVSHGEVLLTLDGPRVDEVVTFAASSRKSALSLMRKVSVDAGTWWLLEPVRLDDLDGNQLRGELYSQTLKPLRNRPLEQGRRAALRRCEKDLALITRLLKETGPGPKGSAALRRTLATLRRVLARNRKA
jgi:hypothetical protein